YDRYGIQRKNDEHPHEPLPHVVSGRYLHRQPALFGNVGDGLGMADAVRHHHYPDADLCVSFLGTKVHGTQWRSGSTVEQRKGYALHTAVLFHLHLHDAYSDL